MSTVVKFLKAHGTISSEITCSPNALIEGAGPTGYESFCHFSTTGATAPHIDVFNNISNSGDIILSGNTKKYSIPVLSGGTDQESIEQYFLENPTREGQIQYIVEFDYNDENSYFYKFIIPGLIYDDTVGVVLGFLRSYLADENSCVVFEEPYGNSLAYNFSGTGLTVTKNGRLYTLSFTGADCVVTLEAGDYSAVFHIYKSMSSSSIEYTIKDVNQYADYAIAAQLAPSQNIIKIKDYFEAKEQVSDPYNLTNNWYPVHFKSICLWSFAEAASNITPSIYKVPVAFVTLNGEKVLMTNVIGISANILN